MTRANKNASCRSSARSEALQDFLLVSSFGLWAVLLGAAPVMAFRLLTGS